MGQRISSFLVVLLLIFSGKISGQQVTVNDTVWVSNRDGLGKSAPASSAPKFFMPGNQDLVKMPVRKGVSGGFDLEKMLRPDSKTMNPARSSMSYLLRTTPVAPSYYASRLGFICRKELQLDKITPIALRFRLGSLDYVNWMEGKRQ